MSTRLLQLGAAMHRSIQTVLGPIDADERLNFHLYLKRLGSSNFLGDL